MKLSKLLLLLFITNVYGIENGFVADSGQFPWAVQIYPSGCSASIIHTNGWVMSGAHCLVRPVNGRVCRSLRNWHEVNCEHFVSGNVFFNPGWPTTHWIGPVDIVIVRLDRDFSNLPGYGPIRIPREPVNFQLGQQVTIAGFGLMAPNVPTDVLRWQIFTRVTGSVMGPNFVGTYYAASNPHTSARPGDSGSGWAMVRDNGWEIIAVTCCSNQYLGGRAWATSISNHLSWIHETLDIQLSTPQGCPKPTTCPLPGNPSEWPTTDARGVYQCRNGIVVSAMCGAGWYTRTGCRIPPIPANLRFDCQQWPSFVPYS